MYCESAGCRRRVDSGLRRNDELLRRGQPHEGGWRRPAMYCESGGYRRRVDSGIKPVLRTATEPVLRAVAVRSTSSVAVPE
jgi:hypothetical protein